MSHRLRNVSESSFLGVVWIKKKKKSFPPIYYLSLPMISLYLYPKSSARHCIWTSMWYEVLFQGWQWAILPIRLLLKCKHLDFFAIFYSRNKGWNSKILVNFICEIATEIVKHEKKSSLSEETMRENLLENWNKTWFWLTREVFKNKLKEARFSSSCLYS